MARRRIGVVASPGDRQPGRLAPRAAAGDGVRCRSVEVVTDELEASRLALDLANPGGLVVLCADRVEAIVDELQPRARRSSAAGAGA